MQRGGNMDNIISILLFISIFLMVNALLYIYMLKDKEIEKRMNYYLNIEERYKVRNEEKVKADNFKGFMKNSNEGIRGIIKKGVPGKDQKKIIQKLAAAGVTIKPEEFLMSKIFFAVFGGFLFYLVFSAAIIAPLGMILGYMLPETWLTNKKRRRVDKFNDELADMITTIIGSLKAGYSFSQALKTVAEESESPVKEEIQTMINELNYGITMEEALNNLKDRMPSADLELMIHSVLIQRQIGGNLSVILEVIVSTIRERKKLERQVRTLTAQGRLSGRIIAALPVVLGIAFFLINRNYMMQFFNNIYGQVALGIGICLTVLGFIVINRITKIEV
jgi:tight adherence protein B